MSHNLNITISQANFTIGAIENNLLKIISIYQQITQTTNAIIPDLVVFSENSISGYPAEDLYLQPNFQQHVIEALDKLKSITKNSHCAILIGSLKKGTSSKALNAAFLISKGEIIHSFSKVNLPNYGVFDEQRYFQVGTNNQIFELNGHKIAAIICEDFWYEDLPNYLCAQGAEIIIAINSSPFTVVKDRQRKALAKKICLKHKVDLVYVNQVGGQDELIFDGGSFALNREGDLIAQLDYFTESQANISWEGNKMLEGYCAVKLEDEEYICQALRLGLKDYIHKNGFSKVILGLSGGIDSAITAKLAVDALGSENVIVVMLPSQYTSNESILDAQNLAKDLRIELLNLPIELVANSTRNSLSNIINLTDGSLTDQNIQARIRGLLLMALSNQMGCLLLSTGNKSENSVGYSTLYGDMCGGYNLLKDIYKTDVYKLASWLKLPESIIKKAPSAELHYNQKDQDNLPEYHILDEILFGLIEENLSIKEVSTKGFEIPLVKRIFNMLKKSEYKRRQSCPGPIISTCSLSKDRRYPMTNHFEND